ncbi:MAG: hypothetical protein K6U80_19640 [Firmicutes bacterium]|nr:hypothetical protein [Bacillota bacterium]
MSNQKIAANLLRLRLAKGLTFQAIAARTQILAGVARWLYQFNDLENMLGTKKILYLHTEVD